MEKDGYEEIDVHQGTAIHYDGSRPEAVVRRSVAEGRFVLKQNKDGG
jgi:hypothetical protein